MAPKGSYLRGTVNKAKKYERPTPASLQQQVDGLRSLVTRTLPEKQYKIFNKNFTTTGTSVEHIDWDIGAALVATTGPTFRELVIGDRWINRYLLLNFQTDYSKVTGARIVVYHAKDPGTALNGSYAGMVGNFDPSAFTILYDKFLPNAQYGSAFEYSRHYIPLRNLVSVYNGSSSNWEKGRIRVCVIMGSYVSSVVAMVGDAKLCFSNK